MYHPFYEADLRNEYWENHVEECIEGKWGDDSDGDKGGYRWIPGNLYFYVNDTQIKIEGDQGTELKGRPLLRDVEWKLFYALAECDGFSGFEGDDEFCSYEVLGKLQGKVKGKLKNYEKTLLERYDKYLRKENGEYKTYVDSKELLYKTYDKPKGKPLYLNEKKNLIVLASRGCGKSYSIGGGVITYNFVFGSSRNLEQFLSMEAPSTLVVGSYVASKAKDLLSKFEGIYEFIRKNIGVHPEISPEEEPSPFYQPTRGTFSDTKGTVSNSVKDEGGAGMSGTGSEIHFVSFAQDASAAVGHRANVIVEEAGLLSNFEAVRKENEAVQTRETKTYYTVYIGTGGNVTSIQGIREAFYKPEAYKCVKFEDNFTNKPGYIGLFIPSYYRKSVYKNKLGNTRRDEAYADEIQERKELLESSKSSYEGHCISYPIFPHEMFLNNNSNPFPTSLLEARLTTLETGLWDEKAKFVELYYTNSENTKAAFKYLPRDEVNVINRWGQEKDMSDEQLKGTIVIYEHPKPYLSEFTLNNYSYLVTYDSVKDEEGGTSIASVTVWKFWDFQELDSIQFNVVAEWKGRHIGSGGLDKDHEIAFKLASYYQCPIFPEINVADIKRHARMTNRYWMLLPKQDLALGQFKTQTKKSYDVGMKILPGMKPDLETFLNEVFLKEIDSTETLDGDKIIEEKVRMVDQCYSMRGIEEALYYKRGDNFDTISDWMLFATASRQRLSKPVEDYEENENKKSLEEFEEFVSGFEPTTGTLSAFSY